MILSKQHIVTILSITTFFLYLLPTSTSSKSGIHDHQKGLILTVTDVHRNDIHKDLISNWCTSIESNTSFHFYCSHKWRNGLTIHSKSHQSLHNNKTLLMDLLKQHEHFPKYANIHVEMPLSVTTCQTHIQEEAPRNLARLDNIKNKNDYEYKYTQTGKGVTVYVLDKGINLNHNEFLYENEKSGGRSRAKYGTSLFTDTSDASCKGHGTHVAGIVGGLTYGVAKNAIITMVEVQPCNQDGSTTYIIQGLDWVLDHVEKRPSIVQMSLIALGESHALNLKVQEIIDAGIPFIVSAGNYGTDACQYSPTMVQDAIVVGNIDSDDKLHYTSNYGKCVDIFAPGVSIVSASPSDNMGIAYMTGTSQAAPHVAGIVAQYLEYYPNASINDVINELKTSAALNLIKDTKGSPNLILQTKLRQNIDIVHQSLEEDGIFEIKPMAFDPIYLFENKRQIKITMINRKAKEIHYKIKFDSLNVDTDLLHNALFIMNENDTLLFYNDKIEISIEISGDLLGKGIFYIDVLIETDEPDYVVVIPLEIYVFCERLLSNNTSLLDLNNIITLKHMNISNKKNKNWPKLYNKELEEEHGLYLNVSIEFNTPIINTEHIISALTIEDGHLELIKEKGIMCSTYNILASMSLINSVISNDNICIILKGNKLLNIYNQKLPYQRICINYYNKIECNLYGAYMIYNSEEGLVTDEYNITIIATFNIKPYKLDHSYFIIKPNEAGKIVSIDVLDKTFKNYKVMLEANQAYYGVIDVIVEDYIRNKENKKLTFKRIKKSLVTHAGITLKTEL